MIEGHGHRLFVGFALVCFSVLRLDFTRRPTHPMHDVSLVILPLASVPRHEPDPEPDLFRENSNS